MKATLDIPTELYRRVKAKSAIEGKAVRTVAVQLFQEWVDGTRAAGAQRAALEKPAIESAPWLAITTPFVENKDDHNLDAIRQSAYRGLMAEHPARYIAEADPAS